MILYKYRDCGKYTDQIFEKQQVWLSTPGKLNDPCECSIHELAPDWVKKQIREIKAAQMSGAVEYADAQFLDEIKQVMPPIADFNEKYKAFRQIHERHFGGRLSDPDDLFFKLEKQLAELGVFSLASTSDHPLMWSHYGEQHEGICLGFELRDLTPSTDSNRFLKVRYADDIPKMDDQGFTQEVALYLSDDGKFRNVSSISLTDSTVRAAISTKSTWWGYEEEWRYIEPLGGRPYGLPGPIVEIIFGLRCPEGKRKHYIDLASQHLSEDVRLYEIRRVANTFRFERVFLGISSSKKDVSNISIPGPAFAREIDDTSVADTHPDIDALILHGQYAKALPLVDDALMEAPNSAKLWRVKGVILGRQTRHKDALECFEKAIEHRDEFFSAWYQKGVALTLLERYPEAASAYERTRQIVPTDASTIYNLALVRHALGEKDETRKLLIEAAKYGHPRAAETLRDLGESDS